MSYVKALKKSLIHVTAYRSDIEVDIRTLKGYKGEFLHASRPAGTNLLLLEYSQFNYSNNIDLISQFENKKAYFLGANTTFYYGMGNQFTKISISKANELLDEFKTKLEVIESCIKQLRVPLITHEINEYIVRYKKRWKREFFNTLESSNSPTMRLIRNRFLDVLPKLSYKMSSNDIYQMLCLHVAKEYQ